MMSRTSVCAPKPMASPTTPAPASSGPMLTPRAARMVIVVMMQSTANTVPRMSGSRVRSRDAPVPPISPGIADALRSHLLLEPLVDRGLGQLPEEVGEHDRHADVDHHADDPATDAPARQPA